MSAHLREWSLPRIDQPTLDGWYDRVAPFYGTSVPRSVFCRTFSDCQVVLEMPFGLIRLDPIRIGKFAHAHGLFWSKEVFKRLDIFEEMAHFAFCMYGLQYILVIAPETASGVRRLVTKIGFEPMRRVDGDIHYELRRNHGTGTGTV